MDIGFFCIVAAYPICYTLNLLPELSMTYPLYALTLFYVGGLLAVSNNFKNKLNWFSSKLWIILPIFGTILCGYVMNLDETQASSLTSLMQDLGKICFTPLIFIIVNQLNVEKLSKSRLYQYLKDMSFFTYAGHFLFCSMIMHTIAPFLSFLTTGKFTVLVLIFLGMGIAIMAGIYWLGKKFLPRVMKIYDGTL